MGWFGEIRRSGEIRRRILTIVSVIIILVAAASVLMTPIVKPSSLHNHSPVVRQSIPVNTGTVLYRRGRNDRREIVFLDAARNEMNIIY